MRLLPLNHRMSARVGKDVVHRTDTLIGIDPLALATITLPQELFELMLELGDEVGLLPQRLDQFADLAMSRIEVAGECRVVVRHTI